MEYIIIFIMVLITILLIYFAFDIKIRKIKEAKTNNRIKELTDRFPKNEEICKQMLKMINNEKVKIKQNQNNKDKTSLYIAVTDTIFIANIEDIYTRIQTIAHECLHSIQNRKMLMFNYVYTKIYNFYFIISIILTILKVFQNTNLQIIILLLMGIVFYIVRSYLETDAMIKAKYLANDYMNEYIKENKICTKEEVEEITNEYDRINKIGIPTYNFILFGKLISKLEIYTIIAFIVNLMK